MCLPWGGYARYHQDPSFQLFTLEGQIVPNNNSNLQSSGLVFKTRQFGSFPSSHLWFWESFNPLCLHEEFYLVFTKANLPEVLNYVSRRGGTKANEHPSWSRRVTRPDFIEYQRPYIKVEVFLRLTVPAALFHFLCDCKLLLRAGSKVLLSDRLLVYQIGIFD